MFHKASKLDYGRGTVVIVTFQDGSVIEYDVASLFGKYPQLTALSNRKLFLSGRLMGGYGIYWNDELDLETETVYCDGKLIRKVSEANVALGDSILAARARAGLSQKQLADICGIDQSDISKIERGVANPSILTLDRIAQAFGGKLIISISMPDQAVTI